MQRFNDGKAEIAYQTLNAGHARTVVWAHGWGQSHAAFLPLASSLEKTGAHFLVDFPGFGESPAPKDVWGTEDYADAMAGFIRAQSAKPVIWVGHSFGCRVGLQMAAKYPELVAGLCLIAAAGLPRRRPMHKKISHKARVSLFKFLKKMIPSGLVNETWLYKTFGSADYKNAGPMRGIFVKTVNEDLSDVARRVKCPVKLIYGSADSETPPEIGRRLNGLIPGSELVIIGGLDHYSVLESGRHQIAPLLKKFIEDISSHD